MSLEFIDDIARGSRLWDAVGGRDADDVVDAPEPAEETTSATTMNRRSTDKANEVAPAIWLEDALTNGCSSPFIDECDAKGS